jgi:uncharacterized protein (TIGR02271 family)
MKTIVGMFDSVAEAHRAVDDLTRLGLSRSDISVIAPKRDATDTGDTNADAGDKTHAAEGAGIGATTGAIAGGAAGILASLGLLAIPGIGPLLAAGPIVAALTGAGIGAAAGGIIGGLVGLGIPEEHAEEYEEGIRRGGTVVSAKVEDARADEAAAILDRHGAVNMETRVAEWRNAGWTPRTAAATDTSASGRTATSSGASALGATGTAAPRPQPVPPQQRATESGARIPVVEESVNVTKREVPRGGVRVYTRTHEQPVNEQVNLRKETVHVERRPADRPATEADLNALKGGAVELHEKSEEAVVNKQARVTGEVVVRKDVENKTETVRDTVRKTEVEVDRLNSPNAPARNPGAASGASSASPNTPNRSTAPDRTTQGSGGSSTSGPACNT